MRNGGDLSQMGSISEHKTLNVRCSERMNGIKAERADGNIPVVKIPSAPQIGAAQEQP